MSVAFEAWSVKNGEFMIRTTHGAIVLNPSTEPMVRLEASRDRLSGGVSQIALR